MNKIFDLINKEKERQQDTIELIASENITGFFDPGWGYGKKGEIKGSKGKLEIRTQENITVFNEQPICLIEYFENLDIPEKPYGFSRNNYHGQNKPKLAKYFKE
jgi:dCTP deaminase